MQPRILLAIATCLLVTACGDGGGKTDGDAGKASGSAKYPDTVEGLKALMTDFSAAAVGGEASATKFGEDLMLKDAEAWFKAKFGDDKAAALAAEYAAGTATGPASLAGMLKAQHAKGRTEFLVERFTSADDLNACGFQQAALNVAKAPLAISSWRALEPGKRAGQHLYNFAFIDGQWKYVGPMRMIDPEMANDVKMAAVASLRAKDRKVFLETGKLPD